jgi:hypothetical protein
MTRFGHPAELLVSYQINRQLSGWILPPQVIRAFGAHCHNQTFAVHSMMLSALARSEGGTDRPSCLAVLRLIDNSNLVAW